MFKLFGMVFSIIFFMVGCAHSTMRGTVAMKASDGELHVCMGEKEVKAGDHVAFFVHQCRTQGARENQKDVCKKIKIGEGEVTQALNEHYSIVKPTPGLKIQEGTVVEKIL